jgi:cytochrome c
LEVHVKPLLSAALGLSALFGACAACAAEPGARLAEEKQCMQCHAVDKHVVGPSFQTIASVYGRMKDPIPKMVAVIRNGSAAHLGPMWDKARMPDDSERPAVSQREARQLARWILSQAER